MTPEAARYLDKARAILAIELGEDAGRAAYLGALEQAATAVETAGRFIQIVAEPLD